MKRTVICLFIQLIIYSAQTQDTMKLHYQVGFEVGKYARSWQQQFNGSQIELSTMFLIPKVKHYFPKVSMGFGDNLTAGGNYNAEIKGCYFKPGIDYYFGKFRRPFRALVSTNLIYGHYQFANKIAIEDPVWGNRIINENYKGGIFGIELGGGGSILIEKKVEIKFLLEIRQPFKKTTVTNNAIGIIPGYGRSKYLYDGSDALNIFISFRF